MVTCSLVRGILSFLPSVLVAKYIGLGNITDAYLMALSINQIIIKFTRVGTLPKAFIMALSDDFVKNKKTFELHASNFLNILLAVSVIVVLLIYITAPFIVNIIAQGFNDDKRLLTVGVIRILAPLFIYQFIVGLFESIFKLSNQFSRWAIFEMVVPFIVAIAAILYISKIGIYSVIYGTLIGAFIHLSLLIYYIYFRSSYSYRLAFDLKNNLVRRIPVILYPFYLSSIFAQVMLGIQSFLASLLPPGVASAYFYALRIRAYFQDTTVNIFSEIAFPYFIKKTALKSITAIKENYSRLISLINYSFLPLLIIAAVFGMHIINVLFANKFTDPQIVSNLSIAFACFMIFFIPELSSDMQSNIILAGQKVMWFNLVNIYKMAVVILLSLILFKYFKFWGLVFSYSLMHLQGFLINDWYLRKKYSFENILFNRNFRKVILLNFLILVFCLALNKLFIYRIHTLFIYQKILVVLGMSILSIVFYLAASYLFKSEELKTVSALLKKDPGSVAV